MIEVLKRNWSLQVSVILSLIIFVYDNLTPVGSADYIFYFFPVVITIFQDRKMAPVWIAAFTSVLSYMGFLNSPSSDAVYDLAVRNRLFAGSSMWICALMSMQILTGKAAQKKAHWVRLGINEVTEKIRGELKSSEIGAIVLSFLKTYTGAQVGAIFALDDKAQELKFLSGMGFSGTVESIKVGDGLVGEASRAKDIQVLRDVPTTHLKIKTSLGESDPKAIALIPLLAEGENVGVMELAFRNDLPEEEIEFLDLLSEPVGVALKSAQYKLGLKTLLEKTQQQAEELQTQQEELRVTNEELEQQSRVLKESQARLENQQVELEQSNQQLEEQTQSLEHQASLLNLANRDLEESKKNLEKASKYKSEFLANMSHELRTPLNSSLILAKLLSENKDGNLNAEQVEYANVIYQSGNDLLNLINDILDLSKVEAGKMKITPEPVRIDDVKSSLENVFNPLAGQKNLKFSINVDSKVPDIITTDKLRLEQILKNLLSNAIKFTTKGSVTLNLTKNGSDIEFQVMDTGLGIKKEEQEKVFGAFHQADGTSSRKFGGTGLGLSISRELAKILNGHISLQSKYGEGSTFTLHIPEKFSVNEESTPRVEITHVPSRKPEEVEKEIAFSFTDDRDKIEKGSRSILIIEDDESFAKILTNLARESGFKALASPTADEGLRLARNFRPEAILLDIRLPDHSGLMVLDQLKSDPKLRHVPVHVISSTDLSKPAREMGAFGYAVKPVDRDQLQVVFQNITSYVSQKKKHVLIVEDNEIQRDHIEELIAGGDVEVDSVSTAEDALKNLSSKTYDCMIMDLGLPDLSGYDLLSKISQENSSYSFPPVIVYTARDLTSEEESKLRHFSNSIIIKGAKSHERLLNEVTLFLHRVESDLPVERQRMLRELRSREKALENKRILIVDDDVRNIFALSSALENWGAEVIIARNGKESLEQLEKQNHIDLVLMDIMMPEMDGYEAITRIRQDEAYRKLPIIALTAKTMKDDQAKCIAVGANDYLSKPLDIEKLLSLLRVWLPAHRNFIN